MEDKFKEYYQGKKVLITGGLGFIGSNLAIKLVEAGAEVTLIDSMIPEYGGNFFNIEPIKDKVKVNISDVRDRSSMNFLVKNIDCLFNLAGTLSHIDSMRDPFTDLEINCVSQLSILEVMGILFDNRIHSYFHPFIPGGDNCSVKVKYWAIFCLEKRRSRIVLWLLNIIPESPGLIPAWDYYN